MATFSIIVGTAGRKTLNRTLASITPQLEPGDEVMIVRDDSGDAGDTPRNQSMHRAAGSHLLFMDDDDVYVRAPSRRCAGSPTSTPAEWASSISSSRSGQSAGRSRC